MYLSVHLYYLCLCLCLLINCSFFLSFFPCFLLSSFLYLFSLSFFISSFFSGFPFFLSLLCMRRIYICSLRPPLCSLSTKTIRSVDCISLILFYLASVWFSLFFFFSFLEFVICIWIVFYAVRHFTCLELQDFVYFRTNSEKMSYKRPVQLFGLKLRFMFLRLVKVKWQSSQFLLCKKKKFKDKKKAKSSNWYFPTIFAF